LLRNSSNSKKNIEKSVASLFSFYGGGLEGARTKAGVVILVRQNVPHSLLSSFQTKVLECIGISVSSSTGAIHFISTYRPGGRCNAEDIRNFKSDIQLLMSSRTSFFICGDLNTRQSSWGCARANSARNALFECGGDFAIYYPPPPTRIPLNRHGLHELDYLSTRTELSSDHLPVLFEATSDSRREVPFHYIFNYKHADWNQFKLILDSRIVLDFSIERIQTSSQIDLMVESFTTAL
jgi:Endonuclease-reverse transcriptase